MPELTHIEHLLGWYNQKPVEVRDRKVPTFKQKQREEESRQKVESAVNRFLYTSER